MTFTLEPGSPAHRLYLDQLAVYLRRSRQILAAWDHYSDRHCDPETFQPYDEDAYGLRQQQRDADTLSAFGRVFYHADELVHVAEQQLAQLQVTDRTRRYAWQVRELRDATERLYAVRDDWMKVHRALPESHLDDAAYEEALAESYADAWSELDQWALHGQALFAVNALAQKQPHANSAVAAIAPPAPTTAAAIRR